MKKTILYFVAANFTLLFFLNPGKIKPKTAYAVEKDSLISVSFAVVGDLMCHSVQYNYARVNADSFDFNPVYREVKEYLSQPDFTFGNLETVTAGKEKGYSGYPFFNAPDEYITALKENGLDLLATSNNHSLDRGEQGIRRTIQVLKENDLNYNGTYLSPQDRDSIRLFDIKGLKVAFLAYSYGTNGNPVPKGKDYLINLIKKDLIKNDLEKAKALKPDLIIVHYHLGEEYQRLPNSFQKEIVNFTVENGADIIIGGHPHVLQPAEFYKTNNARLDTGFVVYSMGNFFSNQRWRYSDAGAIVNFTVIKNVTKDSVYLSSTGFIPTWVYKGECEGKKQYIILTPNDSLNNCLTADDKQKMQQAFEDTRKTLSALNMR